MSSEPAAIDEEFLDIMFPVRCHSCNENIASRIDEYELLCQTMSPKESLDAMKITQPCTRQHFITGGSNLIVTSPCTTCVEGNVCPKHNIWTPPLLPSMFGSVSQGSQGRSAAASPDQSQATPPLIESPPAVPPEKIPVKEAMAVPYDSRHIPKVNYIPNMPKSFGIPVHLSEYDSMAKSVYLESNDEVKVTMGHVYKTML